MFLFDRSFSLRLHKIVSLYVEIFKPRRRFLSSIYSALCVALLVVALVFRGAWATNTDVANAAVVSSTAFLVYLSRGPDLLSRNLQATEILSWAGAVVWCLNLVLVPLSSKCSWSATASEGSNAIHTIMLKVFT